MPPLNSTWTSSTGLPNLITKLLHLNMVGYGYLVSDVIGGNGWNDQRPDKELFIRWMQATIFMPVIQFSYAPWDYDVETMAIANDMMKLRSIAWRNFTAAFVSNQPPINGPIWWVDPSDKTAQRINDGMTTNFVLIYRK